MTIKLYNNASLSNRLYKRITELSSSEFFFKSASDVVNPTIILSNPGEVKKANYAYIEEFGRYYFVESYQILDNNRVQLSLKVDVLMSFSEQILNSTIICNTSTTKANWYIPDGKRPMEIGKIVFNKKFTGGDGKINSDNVTQDTRAYILTTF